VRGRTPTLTPALSLSERENTTLTPALSLRERENTTLTPTLSLRERGKGGSVLDLLEKGESALGLSPLPEGEG